MSLSGLSTFSILGASFLLAAGMIWQKVCRFPPPWRKELDKLGQPRKRKLLGTVIVCGVSIAGTVTARILADHFERVILVDPEIENNEKPKTRIMQYNASHIFLNLFVTGAKRLWPDFDAEFVASGGRLAPADPQLHYSGIPLLNPYQEYPKGSANITVLAGTVRGFEALADRSSIQTVIVRKPDGTQVHLNNAALVADCTGSIQSGLKWLPSAGFPLPADIRRAYNSNLRYVTICFTVPPKLAASLPIPEPVTKAAAIYINGQHIEFGSSFFSLFATDNDTMQLMLLKLTMVVPFLAGFRSHGPIPSWLLETIDILCEPGNPAFNSIKIPTQSYVEYNRLPAKALPSNFVAVGDANLQLNPVHGQGFSKIILNGLALNTLLTSIYPSLPTLPRDFASRYFKNNAVYTHGLWDATRFHDYGTSTCQPMKGETHNTGRLIRWLELKMVSAATQDDEVASALWHVRHLMAADTALLAPTVLWKALWAPSRF
ncbi:hypothetical protein C8R47DRAFT_1315541 [Mycena vitilis]|nr:hypothetical protein C8R47DRAFT_1315541 [Mycena vitilis]